MRTVGALIYPGFELLDLFGPLEFLGILDSEYHLELVAENAGPVASAQGPEAVAATALSPADQYDVLFVPGGPGARREVSNLLLIDWLATVSGRSEWVLGVCTGNALLAKSGVLDGCRATTNKEAFAWVCAQGPKVDWVGTARWVEDGKFFTSSGVSAGMDMTLAAISRMLGADAAEQVAKSTEYTWHSDSSFDPFAVEHGLS